MSHYKIIKVNPENGYAASFETLPIQLYPKNSQRFVLGHEPSEAYLEGRYVILLLDQVVGRFAFYENPLLAYQGEKTASLGSYECIDEIGASNYLLAQAKSIATQKGYRWLVGPMEGSTWDSYRFSDHNESPNFFMEPYHHSYYNDQFKASGFDSLARYVSNVDEQLETNDTDLDKQELHFKSQGARFRTLDMNDYRNELIKIGKLSIASFKDNLFYTPIDIDQFVARYIDFKKYIDPEFIQIIENGTGETQAFLFAIHDQFDTKNETLIFKSITRKIDSPYKGITRYLAGRIMQLAKRKGYKKIIHALMVEHNHTVSESVRYDISAYKSYTLYGVRL